MRGHRLHVSLALLLAGHLFITGALGWSMHALMPHSCAGHSSGIMCESDYASIDSQASPRLCSSKHACCSHRSESARDRQIDPSKEDKPSIDTTSLELALSGLAHPDACALCQFLGELTIDIVPSDDLTSTPYQPVESRRESALLVSPERLHAPRGPPLSLFA